MIDIHSHVLYGVDDGAQTLEDSLAMIRMAADHGTTELVMTPHASPQYKFQPEEVVKRLEEIRAACAGALTLYSGCDFHLSYENIQDALEHPTKYTINHKNYLLVEFSDLLIFRNTSDIFDRLSGTGMIPIVTHPERNGLLRQRVEEMAAWVSKGALLQVTAQSLTGHFGKQAQACAKELLDRRLVHFIASDGHDLEHRPPVLDQARAWLTAHYSADLAEMLCEINPRQAVEGEPVETFYASEHSSPRKWYQIWR